MLFYLISFIISLFLILFSVMFVTLTERKILGFSQNRVGPNKISFLGLLQPLMDGLKLLQKEIIWVEKINKMVFLISPILMMMIMFLMWMILFLDIFTFSMSMFSIMFLCLIGLNIYSSLFSGWSSNSKYSLIGALRLLAQSISYEVCLSLLFFPIMIMKESFELNSNNFKFGMFYFVFIFFPWISLWMISCLAESNRAPLDFGEGESELVSGFNVEYGSNLFAFLFIGEYGILIFFSFFSSFIFFNNMWISLIFSSFFIFLFLLIRSCFPRFRYDKLMELTWIKMMPVSILLLLIPFFYVCVF